MADFVEVANLDQLPPGTGTSVTVGGKAVANEFVLKRTITTDLLPAIEPVLKGGSYVSPGVLRHH